MVQYPLVVNAPLVGGRRSHLPTSASKISLANYNLRCGISRAYNKTSAISVDFCYKLIPQDKLSRISLVD